METITSSPGPRTELDPWYTSSPFEPIDPPISRLDEIDFTDPMLYLRGDPHAAWRLLREEAPVFWHERPSLGTEGQGFWVLARHADFLNVLRDAESFGSVEGPLIDVTGEQLGANIATMDPPRHTQMRRVVQRFFTPKAVAAWSEEVRGVVSEILDDVEGRDVCDFAVDIALRLPVAATSAFLGLERSQWQRVQELQEVLHDLATPEALAEYTGAGLALFQSIIDERRAGEARDDLIGSLINSEVDGQQLDDGQLLAYLWLIFIGGLDSTAHAAAAGMLTLFHHPDQLQRLVADPTLMPNAVEEMLRWTSVSQHLKRKVYKDVELHGQQIKAGQYVVVFQASANRDVSAYPDPFRFDVGRSDGTLATFGRGPHLCPGLHLARLELSALFEQVLERFPGISQAGPAVRAQAFSVLLPPIKHLPVSLRGSA